MKLLRQTGFSLILAGLVCLPAVSLLAGEAIVFGNAKPAADPNKRKISSPGPLRLDKLTAPAPFDLGGAILPRIDSKPRKDKRQQNAEDERRNWMFLDQGELDSKDADNAFMGVREDDKDELDKGKDSHDYTFKDSRKLPGQPRSPGARRTDAKQAPAQQRVEDETETKHEARSSAIVFGDPGRQPGGRLGAERDLQGVLGKANDDFSDKSSVSLGGLFSSGDSSSTPGQRIRLDAFKERMFGGSDLAHTGPSFPAVNPTISSFSTAAKPMFDGGYLVPRQSQATPSGPGGFFSSSDAGSRPSSGPSSPTPAWGWKPTEVPVPRPH